jgi:RNA polymerase sigma-70 factor, ECF subfamily
MIDDSALVKQLQTGNLDALGILYDRHQHLVYRTARMITGDEDAAADLLQDVFLRLHRFSHHIDPERPLQPWLYRMTANLSYTWLKSSRRWLRPFEEMVEWLSSPRKHFAPFKPTFQEDWQEVEKAISRLPLQQRMVVVLFYLNDLTVQEISEILDVPVGTVKSRLHYGREELKQILLPARSDRALDLQSELT